MKRILSLLLILFVCAGYMSAQNVVHLKNGSIIKGKLIELTHNESVSIMTQDGSILVFTADEVISIKTDKDAQQIENQFIAPRGYRGFVDVIPLYVSANNLISYNVTTTHGYQFNHNVFVGGGTGIDISYGGVFYNIPFFAEFRGNVGKKRAQFTYGARLGGVYGKFQDSYYDEATSSYNSNIETGMGFYSGLSCGVRIAYTPNFAMNFSYENTMAVGKYSNFGLGIRIGFEF